MIQGVSHARCMKVWLLTSTDRIDPGRNPTCLTLPEVLASREIVDHRCIFAALQEPFRKQQAESADAACETGELVFLANANRFGQTSFRFSYVPEAEGNHPGNRVK